MNSPTPAIVAQSAVRRLPRAALLLLSLAYVVPGFWARSPWKTADVTAYGYMASLASGASHWYAPQLQGLAPEFDALLPYWLGAWAIRLSAGWLDSASAARIPFCLLLGLALCALWYASYYLARSPRAQPVAFAFGGEARPADYARALADGALLAFIASLGLAQLAHETTPALAQLAFGSLAFFGVAALPIRRTRGLWGAGCGFVGLSLCGAPTLALLLAGGSAVIHHVDHGASEPPQRRYLTPAFTLTMLAVITALVNSVLALWRWRIEWPESSWAEWQSLARLLLWFTWPAWPLALWTLWRWRRQWFTRAQPSRHLLLPLWFATVALAAMLSTASAERSLLLALPALATLAAFALPTLSRSLSALVDWFTLLFFSGCALIIWVIWVAIQTGVPAQPAANVARLAPGFVADFSFAPFFIAVCASAAWLALVKWRIGRHRAAIWKSLVLPAGGAVLCWVLLMTLWLPLLDYARSYRVLVARTASLVRSADCAHQFGLARSQLAAFQYHGAMELQPVLAPTRCPWLLVSRDAAAALPYWVDLQEWRWVGSAEHPVDRSESVTVYHRSQSTVLGQPALLQ